MMEKNDILIYEIERLKQFIQLLNGEAALKRIEYEIEKQRKGKKIIQHEMSEDDYIKTLIENR